MLFKLKNVDDDPYDGLCSAADELVSAEMDEILIGVIVVEEDDERDEE